MGKWHAWQEQKQSAIQQGRRRYLRQQAEEVFVQNKLRRDQLRAEREAVGTGHEQADDAPKETIET